MNILDDRDNFVPTASNMINFSIEGEGVIIAVDNGDPLSELSFAEKFRPAFNGKCLVIVKSTGKSGSLMIKAESEGLSDKNIRIETK